jgi:hypothetical protein
VGLPDGSKTIGRIVDAAKTVFHGYACREGTLQQWRRTSIADARMGQMIKIVGKLRGTAAPFTAPLGGVSCLWYRTVVQTWDGFLYSPRRIIEQRAQDLYVDDDTGSALVRMQGAEVSLAGMRSAWSYEPPAPWEVESSATTENVRQFLAAHGFELSYHRRSILERMLSEEPKKRGARYREVALRPGDRVAVLGTALQEPDPTAAPVGFRQPALRLVLGGAPDVAIVSDEAGAFE